MSRPFGAASHRTGALILGGTLALALAGSAALAVGADPTAVPSAPTAATAPDTSTPLPPASIDPACAPALAGSPTPSSSPIADASSTPADSPLPDVSPIPIDQSTPEPDTGENGASGDVPDNAVFLTYHDATHEFSIDYVEGWQVTPGSNGVVIRDKDSSETVQVVPLPADIAACVTGSELPALQALEGFSLIGQDRVKANGRELIHLSYHLPAPPDPVTGKRVPSTVDRYYVPGSTDMAIVSLSTPDGVDNVDAFRQMILSLTWS